MMMVALHRMLTLPRLTMKMTTATAKGEVIEGKSAGKK
jgi:hypothetical protein